MFFQEQLNCISNLKKKNFCNVLTCFMVKVNSHIIPSDSIHILRTNIRELRRFSPSPIIWQVIPELPPWPGPKRPFKLISPHCLNHQPEFPKELAQSPGERSLSTSIVLNFIPLSILKLDPMAIVIPSPKSNLYPTWSV